MTAPRQPRTGPDWRDFQMPSMYITTPEPAAWFPGTGHAETPP
jgi:hypothetical protein